MTTAWESGVWRRRHMAVQEVRKGISVGMTASTSLVTVSVHMMYEVTLSLSLPPGSPLPPLPPSPLLVIPPVLLSEIRSS